MLIGSSGSATSFSIRSRNREADHAVAEAFGDMRAGRKSARELGPNLQRFAPRELPRRFFVPRFAFGRSHVFT